MSGCAKHAERQGPTQNPALSKFGLMQITRQRVRPAMDVNVGGRLPSCNGTGKSGRASSSPTKLEGKIDQLVNKIGVKKFDLHVHPYSPPISPRARSHWSAVEVKYGFGIHIIPSQKLAFLQYEFYDSKGSSSTEGRARLQMTKSTESSLVTFGDFCYPSHHRISKVMNRNTKEEWPAYCRPGRQPTGCRLQVHRLCRLARAAMLNRVIHSVVDCTNQVLLLVGTARQEGRLRHPPLRPGAHQGCVAQRPGHMEASRSCFIRAHRRKHVARHGHPAGRISSRASACAWPSR